MSRLTAKRGFLVGLTAVFLVAAQPAQQADVDADVGDLQAQIDALEARVEALEAASAAEPSLAPTPTVTPTATPHPTATATPAATKTPAPTATPVATSTPAPTATPAPTSTPAPTATPVATPKATTAPTAAPAADNILGVDFSKLPTSGTAWSTVKSWADKSISSPDMSDQDDPDNVITLAAALVYKKTGQATYRSKVISALKKVRGTDDGRNLAAGRELAAYVLAADLVKATSSDLGYDFKAELRAILSRIRHDEHGDRTLVKTAEQQGNNWGTHAQGSLAAAYAYLGDRAGLDHTAAIVKGFMGDKNAWNGWNYKQSMSWSVGGAPINPKGATISGHNVDGVIQQDQVRAGSFSWPPPCENYTWEALQGLTLASHLLSVQGYSAWGWQDSAVKRSMDWLYGVAKCPATGDDTATPWLVNKAYGTKYPTGSTRPGKNFGFSDWLFGG